MDSKSSYPKQFKKSAWIAVVGCVVLLAGVIGHYFVTGSYSQKIQAVQNKVIANNRQAKILAADYAFASENKALYNRLFDIGIDRYHERIEVVKLLDILKKSHRLNKLSWEFSPNKSYEATHKLLKKSILSRTFVKLQFSALLDSDILSFVDALAYNLPGAMVIEDIELRRKAKVTPELVNSIIAGNAVDTVGGEMSFFWHMAASADAMTQGMQAKGNR